MYRSILGFTLIELMVACVVMAVLAAIAVPSYSSYVGRQKTKSAQMDLVGMALSMDTALQNTTAYPGAAANTAAVKAALPTWVPAQANDFRYAISAVDNSITPPAYTLQATGTSTMVLGCTITLTSSNERRSSNCPGGATTW